MLTEKINEIEHFNDTEFKRGNEDFSDVLPLSYYEQKWNALITTVHFIISYMRGKEIRFIGESVISHLCHYIVREEIANATRKNFQMH